MPRARPMSPALNAGEWSPYLDGRVDLDAYPTASKQLQNYIPRIQGPIDKRAGTVFVAEVKDSSDRTWLMPFKRSRKTAYQIEFGDSYCRFYFGRGLVLTGSSATITGATQADPVVVTTSAAHGYSNGQDVFITSVAGMTELNGRFFRVANVTSTTFELQDMFSADVDGTGFTAYSSGGSVDAPYEIASPYNAAALTLEDGEFALDYEQSGDVVYITDRREVVAPRKLTRTSSSSWAFSTIQPDTGPFLEENATSTTMYASAATGSITITADAPTFTANHVDALIRLDRSDLSGLDPWESSTSYSLNDVVRSEGHEYVCTSAGTSGTTIPSHTRGEASDGGATWRYVNSGSGVARITSYTSATEVDATVLSELPSNVVGSGNTTELWRLGAWSAAEGYPSVVRFFNDRLCFGKGQRVDFSASDDFENFAPDQFGEPVATSAFWVTMQSSEVNDIVGLTAGDQLIVHTEGAEFVVEPLTTSDPFGPDNRRVRLQGSEGARPNKTLRIGEAALFLDNAGRLLEMLYRYEIEGLDTRDLTVRAEHLTNTQMRRLAFQRTPHRTVYAFDDGGVLLSFAYDRDQNVMGWSRSILGGSFGSGDAVCEDVSVIPDPDGTLEDLYVIVKRTINGVTKRYVEYKSAEYRDGDDAALAVYSDSAVVYNSTSTTTLSGLHHLEGETAQIKTDGAAHPDKTVSAGSAGLDLSAAKVVAGLGYDAIRGAMRYEGGAPDGTSQGRTKRVHDVTFRVISTLGGEAGPNLDNLTPIRDLNDRDPSTPMGSAPDLFSGDARVPWPGGNETDAIIWFKHSAPFPATLVAVIPNVTTKLASVAT